MADAPPAGTTKPIAYAPEPVTPDEREKKSSGAIPAATMQSGGTKPIAYAPPTHDAGNVDPQGYVVRGFSPTERDSIEPPRVVVEDAIKARARYGDRAGEHQWIARRDGVSAWPDVFIGFVLVDAIIAIAATWALARSGAADGIAIAAGGVAGIAGAFGAFHDRWRCVEAVTSRYVRGGASHVWSVWIACGYGVWRGLRKLRRT